MSIPLLIQSHDFQVVASRQKGEWLEASVTGELKSVNGFFQKCWFVIRNILTCGGLLERTSKAVNGVAKKFFEQICFNCPSPINGRSPILVHHKEVIQKMARSFENITAKVCDKNLALRIRDLHKCPEAVEASLAIEQGILPKPLNAGVSGSYTVFNRKREPCGIFKPQSQEAGQDGNPSHINMDLFLKSVAIKPGTSCYREEAAYLLDHDHFAGVPPTVVTALPQYVFEPAGVDQLMVGSFQAFVPGCKHAWDHYQILPRFISSAEGHKIPAHEIHKIAILDIRMCNSDRHLQNYLVDKEWRIHPIDHGYALPGDASNLRFSWMNFNQSKEPFSEKELDYIERLNPKADVKMLKEKILGISDKALFRVEIGGMLLKQAAKRGLTAYQIGQLMLGNHMDPLLSMMNVFVPIPLDRPSYFETAICQNIPWIGKEEFIEAEIIKFLENNN